MIEIPHRQDILSTIPKDQISFIDGHFNGAAFFLKESPSGIVVSKEEFDTPNDKPMPDFFYQKPIVAESKDPFDPENITIKKEDTPRSGYFALKIIEDSRRKPNHLHEKDKGVLCAAKINENWETRYFPKNSLDPNVWNKVETLFK